MAAARELSRQGVAAMDNGQWQQAEEFLTKSLAGAPDDAAARRSLAEVLWHRNAQNEAIEQIEEAVEDDPENSSLRVRAGEMALAMGAKELALAHADRAIRHDPRSAAAWALRGRCYRQLNQQDQALADLHHGLEFDPDNSDILLDVAMLYRQRGMPERSLTAIHHLMDTYPPGEEPQSALVLQGVTLLDLGRPQQACEALVLATQRGAPSADTLYYLAKAYMAAGDADQAATTAQQALALNQSHEACRQLLAQLATRSEPDATKRR